jgi:hypothetical protein|tara:strand:+ start:398 stop:571 length:174 start_codon:yes stop_codon:yes gene_type:complete
MVKKTGNGRHDNNGPNKTKKWPSMANNINIDIDNKTADKTNAGIINIDLSLVFFITQ